MFKGEGVTISAQVIWQDYVSKYAKLKKKKVCHFSSFILWKDLDALAMCALLRASMWNASSELDMRPPGTPPLYYIECARHFKGK